MELFDVTIFKPYPFQVGQKIRIDGGKRQGDWEVTAVNDLKVTLRCPISERTFEWDRFCYLVDERKGAVMPQPDE